MNSYVYVASVSVFVVLLSVMFFCVHPVGNPVNENPPVSIIFLKSCADIEVLIVAVPAE